ncbi:metal ABC transporter solute-binding protein, Zn/Mn family [uncultured Duncaniella sp.]|uniref:metal ABC transporter solute-binding protein, Zn/Mn family n=1 Tax=uncultured Duncaniella sp. TaxID=2768039 RepID=UPI00265826C6|nr:zinc ABC transporter substrate-binding protein [uncultured Duncaniella sp.]
MRLYQLKRIALTGIATCLVMGCSHKDSQGDDKPTVAASIPPIAAIVRHIAGDRMNTVTVCDSNTDPETYEPTASKRMKLGKASIFFLAGYLPFEHSLGTNLKHENADMTIVDTSDGLELLEGTHGESHDHGHSHDIDPHTWTSLTNGASIARTVCSALCESDPDGADVYRRNLASLLEKISEADSTVRHTLQSAPSKAFIVWHPSLSYFARDYGLDQIALGLEGKDLTPALMRSAIVEAAEHDARVMFLQPQYDSRAASAINSNIKAKTVSINPLDSCWIEQIILIANEIARS